MSDSSEDRLNRYTWDGENPPVVVNQGEGDRLDVSGLVDSQSSAGSIASQAFEDDSLPFALRQAFTTLGGAQRNATVISWVSANFPDRWSDRKIGSYLRGCSVNQPTAIGRHSDFTRFLYCRGRGEFELYSAERHGSFDERGYPYGQMQGEPDELAGFEESSEQFVGKAEFAYEAHLRDYLAKNLGLLEAGLSLWTGSEADSIEYALQGRRIDILARDKAGIPVIVELKLSRGHERTLGQALYYRGKLKQVLNLPRVRIIMVAGDVTDELRIASTEITDVDVFSYKLTMQVQKVDLSLPVLVGPTQA